MHAIRTSRAKRGLIRSWFAAVFCLAAAAAGAANVNDALEKGAERTEQAQQAQQRIDQLDKAIRERVQQYRQVNKEIEGLKAYIRQMKKRIASQEKEMDEIKASIDKVTLIERQITPLMLKMVDAIKQFVKLDVPFRKEERMKQVAKLEKLMSASDVSTAEKFRSVVETYQEEIEYGQTIGAYRGTLGKGKKAREVDFLRIGRIALIYQTLDGKEVGIWNQEKKQWEKLDNSYRRQITKALRIAREQGAPDLIRMPVPTPVEAQQ